MKVVLASILAALLGAALGWRWGGDPAAVEAVVKSEPAQVGAPADGRGATTSAGELLGEGWRSWAERVEAATTSAELEAIFAEMIAGGDDALRSTMQRLLGARWAEVDPEAGARFLSTAKQATWALQELMTAWVLRDRAGGLAGLASLDPSTGTEVPDGVLKRLMVRAPKVALEMIRARGKYDPYPDRGLGNLAEAYPDELAELIVEIETARLERGASYAAYQYIRAIAVALTERDPRAALEWADGLPGRMRNTGRVEVMQTWAKRHPKAVVAYLDESGDPSGDSLLSGLIVKALMAQGDIAAAAKWVETSEWAGDEFAEEMARKLAKGEVTVGEAFDLVAGLKTHEDRVRDSVLGSIWAGMSSGELGGAFDVIVGQPAGVARQAAMGGVLKEWMRRDAAAAAAALGDLPAGPARDETVRQMLRATDPSRGWRFAQNAVRALLPEDRPAAIAALFGSETERGAAGNYSARPMADALGEAPESEARAAAAGSLARHWGTADPDGAMAWALGLTARDAEAAVVGAARGWAVQDAFSLSNYLLDMPPGASRDLATVALVEKVTAAEPDSAWQWAARIDDPAARGGARREVIADWAAKDAESARAAIDAAELSAAEREALRAVVGR